MIKRNIQQQRFNVAASPDPTMLGLMSIASQFTGGSPYMGNQYGGPNQQQSFDPAQNQENIDWMMSGA